MSPEVMRKIALERLRERARRIGIIRRSVVAGAIAAFVLAFGLALNDQLSQGSGQAAASTGSDGSAPAVGDDDAEGDSSYYGSDDSYGYGYESAPAPAPVPLTTSQS